jgi:hypothetical protein
MSYTIGDVENDLEGRLHGTSVSSVTNLNSVYRRAAMNLLNKIDPEPTRVIGQITLYDKVYDYASPTDLKQNRIIDIRPQSDSNQERDADDNLRQKLSKDFDRGKESASSWVTTMFNKGTKYLRISKRFSPGATSLDSLDETTGWSAGSSASGLVAEDIIFERGGLQFDLAVSGSTGYIENSSIDEVDLSDFENKSAAFITLYIPSAAALAAITNIILRWGNSDSVYFSQTITTAHLGALKVGKNLLRFDWNGATETGSVDASAIDYARTTVTYDGTAISGLIVSDLFFSLGRIHDIEYYSQFLFNNAGTWGSTPSNTETEINLDEPSYNLFVDEVTLEAVQQLQGEAASADANAMRLKLNGLDGAGGAYKEYKSNNPNQTTKPQTRTYNLRGFRSGNSFRRK